MRGGEAIIEHERRLNEFLVNVFNDILRLEEASLAKGVHKNLSVSEMHVLEAVQKCTKETAAGMAEVSSYLGVTASTLTVAVKTLEQKEYLLRERSSKDKRRVSVRLLAASIGVLQSHAEFHEKLVASACSNLSEAQQEALAQALFSLHHFFKNYN